MITTFLRWLFRMHSPAQCLASAAANGARLGFADTGWNIDRHQDPCRCRCAWCRSNRCGAVITDR